MRRKNITNLPPDDQRCAHHYEDGSRCRQWATKGLAVCIKHNPDRVPKDGDRPNGHKNAYKYGVRATSPKSITNLGEMIEDLFILQQQLSLAIEEKLPEMDLHDLAHLSEVMTGNALRITRAVKESKDMQADQAGQLLDAALDAIAEELDFDL